MQAEGEAALDELPLDTLAVEPLVDVTDVEDDPLAGPGSREASAPPHPASAIPRTAEAKSGARMESDRAGTGPTKLDVKREPVRRRRVPECAGTGRTRPEGPTRLGLDCCRGEFSA